MNEEFLKLLKRIKNSLNEEEMKVALRDYLDKHTGQRGRFELKRTDLWYINTIIETKKYGTLKENRKHFKDAINQLQQYLKNELMRYGILTDGTKIYFFELKKDESKNILKIDKIDSPYGNEFSFQNLIYLTELIKERQIKYLSPLNLTLEFGYLEDNEFMQQLIRKLLGCLESSSSIKQKMLFKEWEKLFRLSEEDRGHTEDINARRKTLEKIFRIEVNERNEYALLFVLHTSLSILIKLLIITALKSINRNDNITISNQISSIKKFFKSLEYGVIFREFGILNFSHYDFFSWYIDIEWDEELSDLLFLLHSRVNLYKPLVSKDTIIDYLKQLYQSYIPKAVRHSFGEFFTPQELAKFLVNNLTKPNEKIIDPTCGSGTFLVESIKFKRNKGRTLQQILNEVIGIDLNPIAHLMSKFNYVINILDLLKDTTDITIPVYIGDCSYTPIIEKIDGIECLKYKFFFFSEDFKDFPEIIFPVQLIRYKDFIKIILNIEELIRHGEYKKAKNFLKTEISYIEKKIHKKILTKTIKLHLEKLLEEIIAYQKHNLNSIWLFLFLNYLIPFSHKDYNVVIGNPPWVRWSNLPTSYKEKIKKTLRNEGLFSSDRNVGGVDLNICALITIKAIENFLKSKGRLIFLLPEVVLKNKSFEGFRNLITGELAEIKAIYKPIGIEFEETSLPYIILEIKKI